METPMVMMDIEETQAVAETPESEGFVAINYITCKPEYRERFEYLFKTRARAIDRLPGFRGMYVLRPQQEDDAYLVVSHWDSEAHFRAWLQSPEFLEGHKRGFEDIREAKARGEEPPMRSDFRTYEVITR
ncbi:MAG: antibiotic biosynthesis monooxygenase [Fimbriimonadales bacterium]|nr:antibiotic biosynthesis monooxygenase [Fimbriimonadales bacterium]